MASNLKDNPLLLPILLWILGIVVATYLQLSILTLAIIGGLILLLLIFGLKKQLLLLILIALMAMAHVYVHNHLRHNNISNVFEKYPQFTQPIEGVVVSSINNNAGLFSFTLELKTIDGTSVCGKVQLYTKSDNIDYGDIIETVAHLRQYNGVSNPGGFDYREYMKSRKIYGSGFTKTPVKVIGSEKRWWNEFIIKSRNFLTDRIENRIPLDKGFFKAIIIGDKSELTEMRDSMNKAGLSHLLAVSGLHVGIISLIILIIVSIIVPFRNLVRIITMLILILFAAICGWSPSVTRAGIMISLYLLGKILSKPVSGSNNLIISALIITLINPNQLFSIGFQLSFLAVYTLIVILPDLCRKVGSYIRIKILNGIVQLLLVTIILSVYLGPITMYYFHQFNLNGIVGNLVGIPILGLILPLALLIIFLPFGGLLLKCYVNALNILMLIFKKWVSFVSELPLHFDFISLKFWQLIVFYGILLLFPAALKKYGGKSVVLRGMIFLIMIPSFISNTSNILTCTFFDCGLGDMVLLEMPEKSTVMVDCGPPSHAAGSFKKSALPYLQEEGLKTIDYLVITHAHNDHYGGFSDLLINCNLQNIIITDEFQNRKIWPDFLLQLEEEGTNIITISDTTHFTFDDVKLTVLHPDKMYANDNINNVSIVIRLDYNDFSLLLNGDLEEEGEHYLLDKYADFIPVDITKVGHHGSKTSSSDEYLKTIDPMLAFIPAPVKNRFGFPHESTLEKYAYLGENLIIAGRDGALILTTNGKDAFLQTIKSQKYTKIEID